ncbi:MAG: stage III sporulation protein AA [Oscillospiraceae bacterium]
MTSVLKMKTLRKIRITEPISSVAEIRLRAGRPAVTVNIFGDFKVCSEVLTAEDINECFSEICRYSVHSFQSEIAEGFITLDGGHRVGICGTAVKSGGKIEFLKNISGLNIRIAHEVIGCSDELFGRVFSSGLKSLLIGGKPLCGKTTVLRDLARKLGARHRVTVIDSRNEISASVGGTPSLDVGLNTDVLCGCSKSEGIMLALRSMSPEVIVCDELADDEEAVEEALFCGVKLIASVHTGSINELAARPNTRGLIGRFDYISILGEHGVISELRKGGELT